MGRILQLEVPEEVYTSLVRSAEQTGLRPEAVAVRWLISATEEFKDDPLEAFIGAFPSDIADWGDEHDKYIGAALVGSDEDLNSDDSPNG